MPRPMRLAELVGKQLKNMFLSFPPDWNIYLESLTL
jgi:hypothetical protein